MAEKIELFPPEVGDFGATTYIKLFEVFELDFMEEMQKSGFKFGRFEQRIDLNSDFSWYLLELESDREILAFVDPPTFLDEFIQFLKLYLDNIEFLLKEMQCSRLHDFHVTKECKLAWREVLMIRWKYTPALIEKLEELRSGFDASTNYSISYYKGISKEEETEGIRGFHNEIRVRQEELKIKKREEKKRLKQKRLERQKQRLNSRNKSDENRERGLGGDSFPFWHGGWE